MLPNLQELESGLNLIEGFGIASFLAVGLMIILIIIIWFLFRPVIKIVADQRQEAQQDRADKEKLVTSFQQTVDTITEKQSAQIDRRDFNQERMVALLANLETKMSSLDSDVHTMAEKLPGIATREEAQVRTDTAVKVVIDSLLPVATRLTKIESEISELKQEVVTKDVFDQRMEHVQTGLRTAITFLERLYSVSFDAIITAKSEKQKEEK